MRPRLSRKQRHSIRYATARINLWEGSIRSGKTIGSIVAWLDYVHKAPPGPLAMIGKTRDTLSRNVLDVISDMAPRWITYTRGAPTAKVLGRMVHVMGAHDAKAESRLRGITLAGAYLDEATLVPEAFWTQLLGRLSVPGARLFATTNPDNPSHWLKTNYLNRAAEIGMRVYHFTLDDNPGLDAEYVASLKREYTGLWYRRFINGDWVAAEGAVFDCWDPDVHVVPAADPDRPLPEMRTIVGVGVDHGVTNPSAGVRVGLGNDGVLYALDEWWMTSGEHGMKPTVAEQSSVFRAWLTAGPAPRYVPVDPAAAAFRAQLHADKVSGVTDADNDVKYGIPLLASLLASGRLKVTDRCTNLIREFPGYAWDPKATEKGEDKPIKVADHALDACRYAIVTTEPLWRRHIHTVVGR